MKKKILALLLVVALTVALAVPALAEDNAEETAYNPYHCVCGVQQYDAEGNKTSDKSAECIGGCDGENHTWSAWTSTDHLPDVSGYWYLTGESFKIAKGSADTNWGCARIYADEADVDIHLDLNGCVVTMTNTNVRMYDFARTTNDYHASLSICDTSADQSGEISIVASTLKSQGPGIWVRSAAANTTVNIYGGHLNASGSTANTNGAAICYEGAATLNMYGGKITGGKVSNNGGAIYASTGTINILGGEVIGYTAANAANGGGAIFAKGATKITIQNATIYAGKANGGAIKTEGTANITMIDATIDGNNAGVTQAGCVFLEGSSTMTMSGDSLITNGYCSNSDSYGKGAGVLLNSNASLTMSGNATITGNKTNSANGGGVHLNATGCKLTVSENAQITGNINKNGSSNVHLIDDTSITIGDAGLSENAEIGVTMATPGNFANHANAGTYSSKYFFADSNDYTVAFDTSNNLFLAKSAKWLVNGEGEAKVWSEAINADGMKWLACDENYAGRLDLSSDMTLDLNGHWISEVNIAKDATLYLFDSATADYTVADSEGYAINYGTVENITGEGAVARTFLNSSNHKYLVVKDENGEYSAHRYYLAATKSVLTTDYTLKFETVFKCDEVLAEYVSDYGVVLSDNGTTGSASYNATITAGDRNAKTVAVTGFMVPNTEDGAKDNEAWATKTFGINAYITVNDSFGETAETINSTVKTTSLKKMVEDVLAEQWDTALTDAQKNELKSLYSTYNYDGFMDDWAGAAGKLYDAANNG